MGSTVSLAFAVTIILLTNRCSAKKQSTLAGNLDDVATCTSTAKTFKQTFFPRTGTFIW